MYTGTLISDLTAMVARIQRVDPDDDRRSNGYCSKHGDYNGRELRCPSCMAGLNEQWEPKVCTHPDCPLDGSLHNTDECVFALPEPEQDFDEYEAYVDRIAEGM